MNNKTQEIIQWWKSLKIQSENDLDLYLENYRILFAYHSGRIENQEIMYQDVREIFENGKILEANKQPITVFEIQNQKMCYEFLKDKIINKEEITERLIKDIHLTLTGKTYDERRFIVNGERPGEYKKHEYVIGEQNVGAMPEEVSTVMDELIIELKQSVKEDQVLVVAAYLHAVFENIHPFADGNGRVGRTLMNYYLMIHGYPPIIIYEEDRKLYFDCLDKFDREEELSPLIKFIIYELEKTWSVRLTSETIEKT